MAAKLPVPPPASKLSPLWTLRSLRLKLTPSMFEDHLQKSLADLDARHLRRRLRVSSLPTGPLVRFADRALHNFASNDYLGLAAHPDVIAAALEATRQFGAGAGASRLVTGTQTPHHDLEEKLASFKNTAAALVFANGYAASTGALQALAGKDDVVLLDKLSHACLVDGARLSGATLRPFHHNDTNHLEHHLRWAREKHPQARIFIVTESVFSMDGDTAPLRDIVELKDRHGAVLMLDEAHGTGILGGGGRGLADQLGLSHRIEVQMGTLGKAETKEDYDRAVAKIQQRFPGHRVELTSETSNKKSERLDGLRQRAYTERKKAGVDDAVRRDMREEAAARKAEKAAAGPVAAPSGGAS